MASMVRTPSASSSFSVQSELTGQAKLEEVTRIINMLRVDLEKIDLLPRQRDTALDTLKIYSRTPLNADPIFSQQGIEVLTKHAFTSPSNTTARHALRVLANALLLHEPARQYFVDLSPFAKACARLRNDNRDDEFLVSRVLFLTTYGTNIDLESLIDEHRLAEGINANLARHAKNAVSKSKKVKDPTVAHWEEMALTETLKLLFNVSHFCPQRYDVFTPSIPHIITILQRRPINLDRPLDAPIGNLVHALINLNFADKTAQAALYPKNDPTQITNHLIQILAFAVEHLPEHELETSCSPVLTLFRNVYERAPPAVKTSMREQLLPSTQDRAQPLGKSESLPSRLLRLFNSPMAPQLRESIQNLLFEMSDKDAEQFVKNVGYGFASGFLFQHNIPVPQSAGEAWSTGVEGVEGVSLAKKSSAGGESLARANSRTSLKLWRDSGVLEAGSGKNGAGHQRNRHGELDDFLVNPITGQLKEMEVKDEAPQMTMEEKGREAERLFTLFERLRKNGVITAENPMRTMQQEGRFEEIASDDDDGDDGEKKS